MRLISYRAAGGSEGLGVASLERWLPAETLLPDGPRTMDELLAGGPDLVSALSSATDEAAIERSGSRLETTELLAPVRRPGKIVAIGRNYREHIDEGIAYLRGRDADLCGVGPGPRACRRVSCSYNSAIWACNDEPVELAIPWALLAQYAQHVQSSCYVDTLIVAGESSHISTPLWQGR